MKKEIREAAVKMLLETGHEKADAALIMLSDGSTITGGVVGTPLNVMDMIGRTIMREPHIRQLVLTAVDAYRAAEAEVDSKKEKEADND